MQGKWHAVLFAVCAAMLCSPAAAQANPLTGFCVNASPTKRYPNPTDPAKSGCETSYIVCQGAVPKVMRCAPKTVFSLTSTTCVPMPDACMPPAPTAPKAKPATPAKPVATPVTPVAMPAQPVVTPVTPAVETPEPAPPTTPTEPAAPVEPPAAPATPKPTPVETPTPPPVEEPTPAPAKPAPVEESTPAEPTPAPEESTPEPPAPTTRAPAPKKRISTPGLLDLPAAPPTGIVIPSRIRNKADIQKFLESIYADAPSEEPLDRVPTASDLSADAPSADDGFKSKCTPMEFAFDVAGDVGKIQLKDVVVGVNRVLGVRVKGMEETLMVHSAVVLRGFPLPVTEDNKQEVSDIVRKLIAYSQDGLVDESDVKIVAVEDKLSSMPDISTASLVSSGNKTICYNNTIVVDVDMVPLTTGDVGAMDLMSGMEELPARGLKKVVRRIADASQSGLKLDSVMRNYVLSIPGTIDTTTVLSLRPSIMLPNDCTDLGPDTLRNELVDAFANGDFTDVLDDGKMKLQATVGPYVLADMDQLRLDGILSVNATSVEGALPEPVTCPKPGANIMVDDEAEAPSPAKAPVNAAAGLFALPASVLMAIATAAALLVAA